MCLGMEGVTVEERIEAKDLPWEAWSSALSFILRSTSCTSSISAVSPWLCQLSKELLSWQGSSVCLSTRDLNGLEGHRRFEVMIPKWRFCTQAFVDFKNAQVGSKRAAAKQCFSMLVSQCPDVSCLCVENWLMFEREGLRILGNCQMPTLRHLELHACDQISSYAAMIPVFQAHQSLLSLRATFQPRAVAGLDFSAAAPPSLMTLGFIHFESVEAITLLLQRCSLEHLWLSANGAFPLGMASAIHEGGQHLKTLALPSHLKEATCYTVVQGLPKLELFCRMRIGSPPFGSEELAADFEVLPGGQDVVLRRRGSLAELTSNGSLWSPYSHTGAEKIIENNKVPESAKKSWKPSNTSSSRGSARPKARPSDTDIRAEIVAAARAARQRRNDVAVGRA
mmetsp:Transcript_77663/g.134579  ORF Transcript_77663/g.134579 Transcript_77663/m.134579 type:complete len:395 (-) Transcript_77663:239-1423(-)